jgi:hypothetical protein
MAETAGGAVAMVKETTAWIGQNSTDVGRLRD